MWATGLKLSWVPFTHTLARCRAALVATKAAFARAVTRSEVTRNVRVNGRICKDLTKNADLLTS